MSNTPNASALFDVFVEAKNALEQLPEAQAQAKALAKRIEDELAHSEDLERQLADLKAQHAATLTALAAKEAALKDATFRHDTLASVLDTIRGAIPVRAVEPEPVPAVSAEAETHAPDHGLGGTGESASDPTHTQTDSGITVADADTASTVALSDIGDATDQHAFPINHQDVAEVASSPAGESSVTGAEHSSTESPVQTQTSLVSVPEHITETAHEVRLYSGLSMWDKPDSITWDEFVAGGGQAPAWYHTATAAQ